MMQGQPSFSSRVISESSLNEIKQKVLLNETSPIMMQIEAIKTNSLEMVKQLNESINATNETETQDEVRKKINELSPYSEEINRHISSVEELNVYVKAGLKEVVINDRVCLIRDINLNYVDETTGLTNKERMERGLAPIDEKTGEKVELHHIGQENDSPLAELTESEHEENYSVLHSYDGESRINRREFDGQRKNHWEQRV